MYIGHAVLFTLICFIPTSYGSNDFVKHLGNVIGSLQKGAQFRFVESSDGVVPFLSEETANEYQTVDTTSGSVTGSSLAKVHAFFSIPYAAPPIGELRFRDTQPFARSVDPINATVPNYIACRQRPRDECWAGYCVINQNEDCLVLNVFVPRYVDLESPSTYQLPVLLWIHGGAFTSGSGTTPKYDGRHLSNATNTIVVTINYRLGAYGFLVYNKGDDPLNGNQGLKDQQMAMKWVQDNIANFGGDTSRVTIFGESAGAQSVMWHMLSPVSQPLFTRAILQSNAAIVPHQTPEEAMNVTNRLLTWLGCRNEEDEFQCLLEADTTRLDRYPAIMAMSVLDGDGWSGVEPFRPIVDGVEFTDQPLTLFQSGKWNTDKDYIIGANTEEVEILQYYVPGGTLSKQMFLLTNRIFLGEEAGPIVAQYYINLIGPDGDDYSKILGIEAGDAFFICPSRAMSRFAFETADNPDNLYFYMFDQAPDGPYCHEVYPKNETCGYVYHSAEIANVFRTGPDYGYIYSEEEVIVNDHMSKYWGNFARNGDPNDDSDGPGYPDFTNWPPYVKTNDGKSWSNIRIEPNSFIETKYKEDICDFWDSLNFYVQMLPPETTATTTSQETTVAITPELKETTTTTRKPTTTSFALSLHRMDHYSIIALSAILMCMFRSVRIC